MHAGQLDDLVDKLYNKKKDVRDYFMYIYTSFSFA